MLLTNLASVVFGFAMFGMALVIPQLLLLSAATGYGLGQTIRVSRARGPKTTLIAGVAIGVGLMSQIWQLMLVSCAIAAIGAIAVASFILGRVSGG